VEAKRTERKRGFSEQYKRKGERETEKETEEKE
jgi:hypothetical protein